MSQPERGNDKHVRHDTNLGRGRMDIDRILDAIERDAQLQAQQNYRIADNFLNHTDRQVAQLAALSVANGKENLASLRPFSKEAVG